MAVAKTFVPPGRVLYLRRVKRPAPGGCSGRARQQHAFSPRWCGAAELVQDGLVVSGSMFVDHFPDAQLLVLQRVADEARSGLRGVAAGAAAAEAAAAAAAAAAEAAAGADAVQQAVQQVQRPGCGCS